MIVFDKELLENTFLLEEAKRLNRQGFVSKEQLNNIKMQLPALKTQFLLIYYYGRIFKGHKGICQLLLRNNTKWIF